MTIMTTGLFPGVLVQPKKDKRMEEKKSKFKLKTNDSARVSNAIAEGYVSSGLDDYAFADKLASELNLPGLKRTHIETRRKDLGIPITNKQRATPQPRQKQVPRRRYQQKSRVGVGQRPSEPSDFVGAGIPEVLALLTRINATLLRIERIWKD